MATSRTSSYKPLWKLLIDKAFNKTQLQDLARVSPATIAKLSKVGNVTTDVPARICKVFDCIISGIREIVPVEPAPESTPTTKEHAHVATH